MFHPESNPLAPKSTGPKKPEKELVEIWLGKDAAAEMEDRKPEMGDEDLNPEKHELTEKEKKTLWEMKKRSDEVTLRNIPKWTELPDEETFKKSFRFNQILKEEYHEGRPLSEFIPRSEETLPSFQTKEVLPHAKVFDIADAIVEAKKKDPKHRSLSTEEVLKVIDEAGYRPATLQELVAYARDYWKPDANPDTLTKAEREIQNAQARYIHSLRSVFSSASGRRVVPSLSWNGGHRKLGAYGLGYAWDANDRFLVLRKSSPS